MSALIAYVAGHRKAVPEVYGSFVVHGEVGDSVPVLIVKDFLHQKVFFLRIRTVDMDMLRD